MMKGPSAAACCRTIRPPVFTQHLLPMLPASPLLLPPLVPRLQNFATIFTYGFLGTLATTAMVSIIAAAGLQLIGMGGQSTTTALAIGTIASCSDTVGILQVNGTLGRTGLMWQQKSAEQWLVGVVFAAVAASGACMLSSHCRQLSACANE